MLHCRVRYGNSIKIRSTSTSHANYPLLIYFDEYAYSVRPCSWRNLSFTRIIQLNHKTPLQICFLAILHPSARPSATKTTDPPPRLLPHSKTRPNLSGGYCPSSFPADWSRCEIIPRTQQQDSSSPHPAIISRDLRYERPDRCRIKGPVILLMCVMMIL